MWLLVDKDLPVTSTKVGVLVKKLLERPKLGHIGTLDPMASGLLILAINDATKLIPYLKVDPKTYEFSIKFGVHTDSLDVTGNVLQKNSIIPSLNDLQAVIPEFIGEGFQIPPIFSALKINGQRAYHLARSGQDLSLAKRPVTIYSLQILDYYLDSLTLRATVSSGFYIRSLARDIAHNLGALGCVNMLRRTKMGNFSVNDAISLEKFLNLGDKSIRYLKPLDFGLDDIPAVEIQTEDAKRICQGQFMSCNLDDGIYLGRTSQRLFAIVMVENGVLKPKRILKG